MRVVIGNIKLLIVLVIYRVLFFVMRGNFGLVVVIKVINEFVKVGYFISKKGGDNGDDFFMGIGFCKGIGVMKIFLFYYGIVVGFGYVVMEVDN